MNPCKSAICRFEGKIKIGKIVKISFCGNESKGRFLNESGRFQCHNWCVVRLDVKSLRMLDMDFYDFAGVVIACCK